MGCGTSKQTRAVEEETVRLRRASQVQVDAVQRAEAAYRRQRMALQKEATSYRRASIEIEKARFMKEMYGGHGGVDKEAASYRRASIETERVRFMKEMYGDHGGGDKNIGQEPDYCFGFHKGRESLVEAVAVNNCPDLTITEVSENENNEYITNSNSTENVERERTTDSLKGKENIIDQISLDDQAVNRSEQAQMLANRTGTAMEGEANENMTVLEPNGVTSIINLENTENEDVEPVSTIGEPLSTEIPNHVNNTIQDKNTTEHEQDIKKDETIKCSPLNSNTDFSDKTSEKDGSTAIDTDNMQNKAKEGDKMKELNKTLEN